jgi:thiol-disulfide isomerase/thioredoxin
MKILLFLGIFGAVIGGYVLFSNKNVGTPKIGQTAPPQTNIVPVNTESAVDQQTPSPAKAKQVSFVDEATTNAFARQGKSLIFFRASWCPTCKIAQQDLDENMSKLPDGLTIVTADYDTTKELQKKYGVTYQHTWVQVDSQGNLIQIWNGGDVEEIIKNIK